MKAHKHGRVIPITPKSPEFKNAINSGSVALYGVIIGGGHVVMIYVLYGYTGGHTNERQAARTSQLVGAIRAEMACQPLGPAALVTDLNADTDDIADLLILINEHGWQDLGAQAHRWGQPDREPTCLTANSKVPTRRDYIFVNPDLNPLVVNFGVQHSDDFPVHSMLRIRIQHQNITHDIRKASKPLSLAQHFEHW